MLQKLGFMTLGLAELKLVLGLFHILSLLTRSLLGQLFRVEGLDKRDHLSPYLFILYSEGLTSLLNQAVTRGDIHGVSICRGSPVITHCFLQIIFSYFLKHRFENMRI